DGDDLLVGVGRGDQFLQVCEYGTRGGGGALWAALRPGDDLGQAVTAAGGLIVGAEQITGDVVEVVVPAEAVTQAADEAAQVRDALGPRAGRRRAGVLVDLGGTALGAEAGGVQEAVGHRGVDRDGPVVPFVLGVVPGVQGRGHTQTVEHELYVPGQLLGGTGQIDGRIGVDPAVTFVEGGQEGPLDLVATGAHHEG